MKASRPYADERFWFSPRGPDGSSPVPRGERNARCIFCIIFTTRDSGVHLIPILRCAICHIAGRDRVTSLPACGRRHQTAPGGPMLPSVRCDGTHRIERSGFRRAARLPHSTWLVHPARQTHPEIGGPGATRSAAARGRTGEPRAVSSRGAARFLAARPSRASGSPSRVRALRFLTGHLVTARPLMHRPAAAHRVHSCSRSACRWQVRNRHPYILKEVTWHPVTCHYSDRTAIERRPNALSVEDERTSTTWGIQQDQPSRRRG